MGKKTVMFNHKQWAESYINLTDSNEIEAAIDALTSEKNVHPFGCGRITERNKLVIWKEGERKLIITTDRANKSLIHLLEQELDQLISVDDHMRLEEQDRDSWNWSNWGRKQR